MKTSLNSIFQSVIKQLDDELPKHLSYHNTSHTLYVLEKAIYISKKEKVSAKDLKLIKLAVLYHDIGFTKTNIEHEIEGCKIAKNQLSNYGYSNEDIESICSMIMATRIPQNPKNLLEMIIADSDLEYLSTNQFKKKGEYLYQELLHYNKNLTREEWNTIQIKFITAHHYHTPYCKKYKEFRKSKNLKTLKEENK